MHSEGTIFMKIPQNFQRGHLREGDGLEPSALLVTSAPGQWRFLIRPGVIQFIAIHLPI